MSIRYKWLVNEPITSEETKQYADILEFRSSATVDLEDRCLLYVYDGMDKRARVGTSLENFTQVQLLEYTKNHFNKEMLFPEGVYSGYCKKTPTLYKPSVFRLPRKTDKDTTYEREYSRMCRVLDVFFDTVAGIEYIPLKNARDGSRGDFITIPAYAINILKLFEELGVMLCGGSILSLFTESRISDLDFYVKDPNNLAMFQDFLHSRFHDHEKPPFQSINAITYKRRAKNRVYTVQLITKFTGEPNDIFQYFDFTITNCAYDFKAQSFAFGPRFFADLGKRVLVYAGKSQYPICALHRINKYIEKGFRAPGSTLMHIALSIVQLNITNYRQLKEQLMGIDTSYLTNLLESKDPDVPVNYGEFIEEALNAINLIQTSISPEDGVDDYQGDI